MNNKMFMKIGWMFVLGLFIYLFFVVFYLSPKINDFLTNKESLNVRIQYNKIVSIVNNKIKIAKDNNSLNKVQKELQLFLSSVILGKSGFIYVFDSSGKIIVDGSGEFESQDFAKLILPTSNNKLLVNEIKNAYNSKIQYEYNWNKIYDPYNYNYKKISWVEYNKELDWYIVSSLYRDDFSSFIEGVNSLILNISMILFGILFIIALFIAIKIIVPLNKIFEDVKKLDKETLDFENDIKSKDEIGFLATQFNSLLDQIETSRKTLDEQVEQKTKEIKDKLYYDDLTNLRNRTALEDEIKGIDFVSIALIDIDSFDDINELYGFSTGNLVLIQTAKILNDFAKKYGVTAYRIHGNVFSLADKKMMGFSRYNDFIEELSRLFRQKMIFIKEFDLEIYISITIGISIAQEEPIKTAGIALKKAKKNSIPYFVYNNEIDTKEIIKKSMYWKDKIKKAIDENRVLAFYQPIFNRNKEIVKYEALMRIKDTNENGEVVYLTPYQFFDVAIKTKQYLTLSNQVISKAFSDLSKTQKQITLNLSFKDILDGDFNESLDRNLDKIDFLAKQRLVFEILESDYISDYSLLESFIKKYSSQGIKIAMDDFGTGYSNFAHILKIRPNYIKIDGSLIKNINRDKNSFEMVKSIIEFAKALGIKTIAEFVHSKEVFNIVLDLGVDEFQGFYLGEPSQNIE